MSTAPYRVCRGITVSDLRHAFTSARGGTLSRDREDDTNAGSPFDRGAEWVRKVLVPAIERGNAELQPEHIAFGTDLNLDSRSTNHPHADFWLTTLGEGERAVGARYSLNVKSGETVWLYRPGAPGEALGTLEQCGPDAVQELLRRAVQEFGEQLKSVQDS
jgi:hypothetical protein